jgi:hypothetical protein
MLQAGRSRVRYPIRCFFQLIFPAVLGPGFTQLLTEMSTRNIKMFLSSRTRPVRRADNLTAICE